MTEPQDMYWNDAVQAVRDGSAVFAATPRGIYTAAGLSSNRIEVDDPDEMWTVYFRGTNEEHKKDKRRG